jgi:hypothetical protein
MPANNAAGCGSLRRPWYYCAAAAPRPQGSASPPSMTPLARHSGVTDTAATVAVHHGLTSPLRVLHLSDSHLSLRSDCPPNSDRMHHAFAAASPCEVFQRQVEAASRDGTELIAHTGDFLNFPSEETVAFAMDVLERGGSGLTWLYSSGNHDWHFEGLDGSSEALRDEWRQVLRPLFAGKNPSHWVFDHEQSGLRFIGIDNSTYQISPFQLNFCQAHMSNSNKRPIVLMVHIPLYLEALMDEMYGADGVRRFGPGVSLCGDPDWGWDADHYHDVERRERWSTTGNLPSTSAFLETVKGCRHAAGGGARRAHPLGAGASNRGVGSDAVCDTGGIRGRSP